jgi:RecB family exonuclease
MLAGVPGSLRFVRYGTAAFEAIASSLEKCRRQDPTAPVTVVAPSARAARALRHRLAVRPRRDGLGGLVNVRFLQLADLAEEFGGQVCRLDGRRPLTRAALGAAARAALRDRPTFLAAVAEHPSTEQELVDLYKEVRQLEAEGLRLLSAVGSHGQDLSVLCALMRERLRGDWFDDVDLVDAAAGEIGRGRRGADWDRIIVHLPEQVRPADLRLLAALAGTSGLVVHLGLVADAAADAPIRRLGEALRALGFACIGEMPRDTAEPDPDGPVPAGEGLEAPDAESETRAAVRLVIAHLALGGAPDHVALLFASPEPYCRLIAGALGEAGIGWSGPSPERMADAVTAKVLSGLLGLAAMGLERAAVMAWLRSAPLRQASGEAVPVGDWERVSRLAGVVGGDAAEWRRHLDALAEENRRALAEEDHFGGAEPTGGAKVRARRQRDELVASVTLRAFIDELDEICREARALHSWSGFAKWSRAALARYLGANGGGLAAGGSDEFIDPVLSDVLDGLGVLDGVDGHPDLARFSRAVGGAFERSAPPTGRLSSGIIVGPLESAIGVELDLVVVLGCVEGDLPHRAGVSAVLAAEDRERVGLDVATPASAVERDRRRLLVAICEAQRTVLARRARDSRDGRARIRSRFVGRDVPTRQVASAAGTLESVAAGSLPAIGESELVSATLLAQAAFHPGGDPHFLVAASPHLLAGSRVVAARGERSFSRFAGRIPAGAGVDGLIAGFLSPTTLEEFAVCPFRYFLGHELDCEVLDPPERRAEIEPRDRGQIAHEVLERYLREVIEQRDIADRDPAGDAARLARIAAEVCDRFERLGRTGKRVLWAGVRRKLLERLEVERARDAEARRRRGARPVAVEWLFGTPSVPAVNFIVGDRSLSFRGKIDRVDRLVDGGLEVIDYKTGQASSYQGIADDPVDRGRHLQLPIYALAARAAFGATDPPDPVRASYRFIDEPGEVAVELDDGTIERTREVLTLLASTVESGSFPCRPGEPRQESFEHCSWCDFNRICPAEREVLWRVARTAPALAGYVDLVEEAEDG